MDISNLALAAVVVVLVVARQFSPRRVGGDTRRMLVLPAVLAVLALREPGLLDHAHRAASAVLLVVGVLLEVALGFAWGFTTRLWRDASGTAWAKGTLASGLVWAGMILARLVLFAVAGALGVATGTGALLLSLAALLLVRTAVVTWRARLLDPSYGVAAG